MSDHRTISKRKDEFYAWLRALAPSQRPMAILAACGETRAFPIPQDFMGDPLIRAWASLAFIQFKYYARYEQGQKYLARGLRGLRAACGEDSRAARFCREAENVAGNFQARHFKMLSAYRHYAAALDGERSIERRALVTINLVRLFLTQGRLRDALLALDRIDPARLEAAMGDVLRMQRARLLFMLGGAPAAEELVRETRSRSVEYQAIELERRYLGLMLRLEAGTRDGATRRIDEFLTWVRAQHEAQVVAFYELECLVVRRALQERPTPWGADELLQAKSLAKIGRAKDTLALYAALRNATRKSRDARAREDLLEALNALATRDGPILFRLVCLGVARRLATSRWPERAVPLLELFDERAASLAATMPPRLMARIRARPSPLLAWRLARAAEAPEAGERLMRALFASD